MICRFEDRLAGRGALRIKGLLTRIEARHADELTACFEAIEAARRQGHWVAMLLDYELDEWLLPEATRAPPTGAPVEPRVDDGHARLTALVFERMIEDAPWPDAPPAAYAAIDSVTPEQSQEDYLRTIEQIRELIADGELYQLNYTQPLHVKTSASPQTLYRHIASRHPVAHAAYIEDAGRTVLSFSPELFLTRRGARLTARPMKGTAPRHSDPQEDTRLEQELLASAKNRAENLMTVSICCATIWAVWRKRVA
jgi:para-aminobenzoate synthetase component I